MSLAAGETAAGSLLSDMDEDGTDSAVAEEAADDRAHEDQKTDGYDCGDRLSLPSREEGSVADDAWAFFRAVNDFRVQGFSCSNSPPIHGAGDKTETFATGPSLNYLQPFDFDCRLWQAARRFIEWKAKEPMINNAEAKCRALEEGIAGGSQRAMDRMAVGVVRGNGPFEPGQLLQYIVENSQFFCNHFHSGEYRRVGIARQTLGDEYILTIIFHKDDIDPDLAQSDYCNPPFVVDSWKP